MTCMVLTVFSVMEITLLGHCYLSTKMQKKTLLATGALEINNMRFYKYKFRRVNELDQ